MCKAIAENDEEMECLSGVMMPAMIAGGFVSVTITSVVIAGFFTKLF